MKRLIFFLAFLPLLTFAQQRPEKGLIFNAPLSQWSGTYDLVGGTQGTPTAVYNVLDRQGNGRRSYTMVGAGYGEIADADRYDVGTGDFSISMKITPANITDNGKYLINKEASGVGYGIYQTTNDLYIRFDDGTTDVGAIIGTDVLVANTPLEFTIVFSRAGSASLYTNRSTTAVGTAVISTASLTLSNAGAIRVGNATAGSAGFTGEISMVRLFNFALTPTQAVNYSKPEYPIEYAHIGTGATKNALNLNAEGMGRIGDGTLTTDRWGDLLNNLTATVSGATLTIPPASNLGATAFNGSSSIIDFTAKPDINNVYSLSLWASSTKTPSNTVAQHLLYPKTNFYVTLGEVTGTIGYELIIIGELSASSHYQLNGGTIPIGWHHYAFVWDGSKYQIYYDGVAMTTTTTGTPVILNATELYIGRTSANDLNGAMKNVKMWGRALSSEEVYGLFSAGE